jgi:hypothetical protein
VDIEQASHTHNAYSQVFNGIDIEACNFHFNQCQWGKIQSNHELYLDDINFALQLSHFSSLAFVPTKDVIRKFEELLCSHFVTSNGELLNPYLSYFEDMWIGRPKINGQR